MLPNTWSCLVMFLFLHYVLQIVKRSTDLREHLYHTNIFTLLTKLLHSLLVEVWEWHCLVYFYYFYYTTFSVFMLELQAQLIALILDALLYASGYIM